MNNSEKFPKQFSDMSSEEFKKLGYATIDWIASYLENIEKYPVLPDIKYGEVKKNLHAEPPLKGENPEIFLRDIDDQLPVWVPLPLWFCSWPAELQGRSYFFHIISG